jgi:integrase
VNPVANVSMPKVAASRERRLEGDEEVRLLAACDASASRWLGAIVRFALATGMRRGEILGLQWSAVNLCERRRESGLFRRHVDRL